MAMKFLLLLSAVALVLGTVSGACNETQKIECIDKNQKSIDTQPTPEDKCRIAQDVMVCIVKDADCTLDDAGKAALDVNAKLKPTDCTEGNPDWVQKGKCTAQHFKCVGDYEKAIEEVGKSKDKGCEFLVKYKTCTSQVCPFERIEHEINEFAKRAKIDKCESVHIIKCKDVLQHETCLVAYSRVIVDLDLKGNKETQCILAQGVNRCLEKKAGCDILTIRTTMKNLLDDLECSEYVNLCDHVKEEGCAAKNPGGDTDCGKLKAFHTCLTTNHTCPGPRVHHIMRTTMRDKIDCADANACMYEKEAECIIDAEAGKTETKEEKCKYFKRFEPCMVRAKCNANYMKTKVEKIKNDLGNPCGASSIMASVGLILLLAAFTGQWK